jgi:2-methylcitrate dehydratase PrpD
VTQPSLSEALVGFALATRGEDIPGDVRANAWLHLIDALGIALMVSRGEYGQVVRRYLATQPPGREAGIPGTGLRGTRHAAAVAFGTLAGAINYDDTHNESQLHPGAHIVPLALVLGEVLDLTGPEVVDAIAIANEVACRLACVAPGSFSKRGFHSSSVLGKVYCAILAARLMRLTPEATRDAVGHAASQAGGLMQCYLDGSWTLAFHHGWAAASALTAAELGAAGFRGPREALEGPLGLFPSFLAQSGITPAYERATEGLGTRWENRRMSFKPYATGCVIHPFIDAALALRAEHGLDWRDVERVTLPIADYLVPIVAEPLSEKRRPSDVFNARVSLPFVTAETLRAGRFDIHSIRPEDLQDAELLGLVDRVDYALDPDPAPRSDFRGWVRIRLRNGREIERRMDPWRRMHVGEPGTPAEVERKFLENVGEAAGAANATALLDSARRLRAGGRLADFMAEVERRMETGT